MSLGNINDYMEDKNSSAVRIPDLDWLMLEQSDYKNIPTPHNVEIIPELQEAWGNTDASSARLIGGRERSESLPSKKIAAEDIEGVINTAKKEMMLGNHGKFLSNRLASLYPRNLLVAAKNKLEKLAQEQGLLGGVYVDLSPFDSCDQASKILGKNRVRLASYVTGDPKKCVCSTHTSGYCKVLGKKVVASVEYDDKLLNEYTGHLKVAGMIGPEDKVESKETLREAILRSSGIKEPKYSSEIPKVEVEKPVEASSYQALKEVLLSEAQNETNTDVSHSELRGVLAYIQNEMLNGKMGDALKESINKNIVKETIAKYAGQIKRAVSLQGLLGNVYVDVSYYKNVAEAVKAIKTASTSPSYLIQTESRGSLDDTLERVAAITGCEILPRDGKIRAQVANSYIDDLQFNSKISSDTAILSRNRIQAGENVLGVLRDAYISSIGYKPPERVGGQMGHFHQSVSKKYANRDKIKEAAYKAIEAGFSIEKVEQKLSQEIPSAEAIGMVRGIIASIKEIDANVLSNCSKQKYQFSHDASLKKASKCSDCIRATCVGCTVQGLRFASEEDTDIVHIDPKTQKVQLKENPDVLRAKMEKEKFEMPDYAGSNINVDLDKVRKMEAMDVDMSVLAFGMDDNLKDI